MFSPDTYIPRRLCLGHRGFNLGCRRQPPCRGESLLLTFSTRTYYCHWQVGRGHRKCPGPSSITGALDYAHRQLKQGGKRRRAASTGRSQLRLDVPRQARAPPVAPLALPRPASAPGANAGPRPPGMIGDGAAASVQQVGALASAPPADPSGGAELHAQPPPPPHPSQHQLQAPVPAQYATAPPARHLMMMRPRSRAPPWHGARGPNRASGAVAERPSATPPESRFGRAP